MKRHWLIPWLVIVLASISGCSNKGHNQNSTDVRAVNAVLDAEPLDVLIDDDVKVSTLAVGSTSTYSEFASGGRDAKVR